MELSQSGQTLQVVGSGQVQAGLSGRNGKRLEPEVMEFGNDTINISVNETLEKAQEPRVFVGTHMV